MNKKPEDSSKSLVTVLKDFKDFVELKKFAESQFLTILQLQKQVAILTQQLKEKPSEPVKQNAIRIEITPEEYIITEQIDHLRAQSSQRALSLEEIKKLDLLVKNYNLIKNQATTIIATPKKLPESEAQLIELAERKLEDE